MSERREAALERLQNDPALEGAFVRPSARRRLRCEAWPAGAAQGALTHLQGPAVTEAVLRLLAAHPGLKAAWIEARLSAYPPGFVQRGVDLACLLFVEAQEHFVWAVTELVRSQAFPLVALASPLPDGMSLRRLQLAAERAQAVVLLAAPLPDDVWPVRERFHCGWDGAGELRVVGADVAGTVHEPSQNAVAG
jgi:hypothetical protein